MGRRWRRRLAAAAVGVGLLVLACLIVGIVSRLKPAPEIRAPVALRGDMAMGSSDAPVTLVAFLSATCPYCAAFDERVLPGIRTDYIERGRLRLVVREVLTPPWTVDESGFLLARCAGPKRYLDVLDALYRGRDEMVRSRTAEPVFDRIASNLKMPSYQMIDCISNPEALNELRERSNAALASGVTGTPTFIINGHVLKRGEKLGDLRYAGGFLSREDFDAAYTQALSREKSAASPRGTQLAGDSR